MVFPRARTHHTGWGPPAVATTAAATAVAAAAGWATTACRLRTRTHELHDAHIDPVTGLLNRKGWESAATCVLNQNPASAVGLADLDGFKTINDQHGHEAGDKVLSAIAQRLSTYLGQKAIIGRLGGDEFVFVAGLTAGTWLDGLVHSLTKPITVTGTGTLAVGVSLGLTQRPRSLRNALTEADRAMYEAKRSRCGWRIYQSQACHSVLVPSRRRARRPGPATLHDEPAEAR